MPTAIHSTRNYRRKRELRSQHVRMYWHTRHVWNQAVPYHEYNGNYLVPGVRRVLQQQQQQYAASATIADNDQARHTDTRKSVRGGRERARTC